MTWEKFWSIIDRVRAQADMQDEASVKQFLYTELINLPQDELLGFDCAWQSYRNQANFPKMVAAACIINDGSSDDRFTDFRNWLIMQGYDAYRQALIDPDNLAALNIPFRDTEWMGCGNVAWYAYAGQQLHTYFEKETRPFEMQQEHTLIPKNRCLIPPFVWRATTNSIRIKPTPQQVRKPCCAESAKSARHLQKCRFQR